MGLLSDIGEFARDTLQTITGQAGAEAATEASQIQAQVGREAIEEARLAREQAAAAVEPFREAGIGALPGLTGLVTDTETQRRFIQDNPFFNALAEQAQRRLFQNQAARGKIGSGGTAEALQQSFLTLGPGLLNQAIAQRQNLATLGANAAAGQATTSLQSGQQIGNLLGQLGNVQAAGIIGAQNARTQGLNNLAFLGLNALSLPGLRLSDRRTKTDIKKVGKTDEGVPIYTFKYIGDNKIHMNVMAQDLEKKHPESVVNIGGVKFVNMEKVNAA